MIENDPYTRHVFAYIISLVMFIIDEFTILTFLMKTR